MHALNLREKYMQRQMKLMFNLYRDSLEDIIERNIDNGVFDTNNLL